MEKKRGGGNKANSNNNNNATVTNNSKSSSNSTAVTNTGKGSGPGSKAHSHHSSSRGGYRGGGRGRGRGRGRGGSVGRKGRSSSHNVHTTSKPASSGGSKAPVNNRGSDEISHSSVSSKANARGGPSISSSKVNRKSSSASGATKTALGNIIPSSRGHSADRREKPRGSASGSASGSTSGSGNPFPKGKPQRAAAHNPSHSAKQSHPKGKGNKAEAAKESHPKISKPETAKRKESSASFSSLHKQDSNLSWIDMDDDGDQRKSKADRNANVRSEPAEPEQISAAARAIAKLQEKVNKLTRENMALRDNVSIQKMNLERETQKSADLEAALEKKRHDYGMLEDINNTLGKVRTRLEAEKESYRVKLLKSERERKELAENANVNDGKASQSDEARGDLEARIRKLELELENKQSLLDSAERKTAALKIDIEYHQAQEEYHKIRLENMEAEIKSKDEELRKLKSIRSKLQKPGEEGEGEGPDVDTDADYMDADTEAHTVASPPSSATGVESKEEKGADNAKAKDKVVNKHQDVEIPSDNIISSNIITKLVL